MKIGFIYYLRSMTYREENKAMQNVLLRMARLAKMRAKRFDTPFVYSQNGNLIALDIKNKKKKSIHVRTKI